MKIVNCYSYNEKLSKKSSVLAFEDNHKKIIAKDGDCSCDKNQCP